MEINNVIYNTLRNKYYFKIIKSYFRCTYTADLNDWRYKYNQWSSLIDLVNNKYFNLIRYRLKREDYIDVSVESIRIFCQNVKCDTSLFQMVYHRYRQYFLAQDLLLIAIENGNIDIVRVLAQQTSPIVLMRKKSKHGQFVEAQCKDDALHIAWENNHFHIYFYLLENIMDDNGKPMVDNSFRDRLNSLLQRDPKRVMDIGKIANKESTKQEVLKFLKEKKYESNVIFDTKTAEYLGVKTTFTAQQFELAYEIAIQLPEVVQVKFDPVYPRKFILNESHHIPYEKYFQFVEQQFKIAIKVADANGSATANNLLLNTPQLYQKVIREFMKLEVIKHCKANNAIAVALNELRDKIIRECISTGDCVVVCYLLESQNSGSGIHSRNTAYLQIIKYGTNEQWQVAHRLIDKWYGSEWVRWNNPEKELTNLQYINPTKIESVLPTFLKRVSTNPASFFASSTLVEFIASSHMIKIVELMAKYMSMETVKGQIIKGYSYVETRELVDINILNSFLDKYHINIINNSDNNDNNNNNNSDENNMYQSMKVFIDKMIKDTFYIACRNGRLEYVMLLEKYLKSIELEEGLNFALRGRHLDVVDYFSKYRFLQRPHYGINSQLVALLRTDDVQLISNSLKGIYINPDLFDVMILYTSTETLLKINQILRASTKTIPRIIKVIDCLLDETRRDKYNDHWTAIYRYPSLRSQFLQKDNVVIKAIKYDNRELLRLIYKIEDKSSEFAMKIVNEIIPTCIDTIILGNCLAVLSYSIKIGVKFNFTKLMIDNAHKNNTSLFKLIQKSKGQ